MTIGRRPNILGSQATDVGNPSFLFVYGTLRRLTDRPMHRVLVDQARFIGVGRFRGKLYNLGRFPGAIPSALKSDRVVGAIYRIKDPRKTFQLLDEYEGNNGQFIRKAAKQYRHGFIYTSGRQKR